MNRNLALSFTSPCRVRFDGSLVFTDTVDSLLTPGHLYKTDTSVKRTPRVLSLPFFPPSIDSL